MNSEIEKKLSELAPETSKELEEALLKAESLEEILALLKANGIDATLEDLTVEFEDGELTEDALEDVAGGSLQSLRRGFSDGFNRRRPCSKEIDYTFGYVVGTCIRNARFR